MRSVSQREQISSELHMMIRAQGEGWIQLLGQVTEAGDQGLDRQEPTGYVMPLIEGGSLQHLVE